MKFRVLSAPSSFTGLCCIVLAAMSLREPNCQGDEFPESAPVAKTYDLVVSPAAESKPALKYRLVFDLNESTPGNSVDHYNRAMLLYVGKEVKPFESEWFGKPYDKLPVDEVREWLQSQKLVIDELVNGSHCETCDWGYRFQDLRGRAVIEAPMPEIQNMRQMARLLDLKATIEIGDKKFDEALETLKTQFCLARDLGKCPNLIPNLVGIAIQAIANESLIRLMSSQDSPNLYWTLRNVPSPLIDLRAAVQMEATMLIRLFPVLKDADKATRSPEEWKQLLFEAYTLAESEFEVNAVDKASVQKTFDSKMTQIHPIAKRSLTKCGLTKCGVDEQIVDEMPVGQVVAIYTAKCHREMMDEIVKWMLLPFAEGKSRVGSLMLELVRDEYMQSGGDTFAERDPLSFNTKLTFSFEQFHEASCRQFRLSTAMSVVEAVRLHASHAGKLPKSLSEITIVTIPNDPGTGKPFLYRVVDGQAELLALPTMPSDENSGRRFKVKLR